MGWLVVHRLRACVCVCACVRMCARAPDGGDGINCRREEFRGRWRWCTSECVSVSWLVVMVVVAVVMVMLLVLSSSLLHLSDAGAGHGDAGRLELDLGISPSLVHGGTVRGHLAHLGHFHRRLVLHAIVPGTLGRGSGLVVLVGRRAGRLLRSARGHLLRRRHLLGHLLRVGDDGRLLLDGRRGVGGVQGVRGRLCGLVRVEAVLGGRAAARRREGAGAALDGARQAGRRVRDLHGDALDRLPRDRVLRRHGCRVHGGDARVVLLRHVVRVLRQAGCPVQHGHARVLLVDGLAVELVRTARERVAVAVLWHVVLVHVLAKVGERGSPVQAVAVGHGVDGHALRRPLHGVALGRRGRLVAARLRGAVVQLRRVDAALVRPSLVLDHGGLSAEAAASVSVCRSQSTQIIRGGAGFEVVPLEAAIMGALVRPLACVDAAVSCQTRRLLEVSGLAWTRTAPGSQAGRRKGRRKGDSRRRSACCNQGVGTCEASRRCECGCAPSRRCAG